MAPVRRPHSAARRAAGAAGLALGAWALGVALQPVFLAPLRAAAVAGALLTSAPDTVSLDGVAQPLFDMGGSSVTLAKGIDMGGKVGGGLEGTYEMKGQAKKNDFVDDEKALAADEKFEQKFDSYVGVFAILFVGAFIAPMVTYFWYVRDEDPWQN